MMGRRKFAKSANGATLGFEQTLWQAADSCRVLKTLSKACKKLFDQEVPEDEKKADEVFLRLANAVKEATWQQIRKTAPT